MPVLQSCIIDPMWDQFSALIPERVMTHPLKCHRPQIPNRIIFDKLIQIVVLGISYNKIADSSCSATTLRSRRDEWIALGGLFRNRSLRDIFPYQPWAARDLAALLNKPPGFHWQSPGSISPNAKYQSMPVHSQDTYVFQLPHLTAST